MPHVVLLGKIAVEDIFRELKPIFIRNEKMILKTLESYLERDKNSILIDSLAIEGNKKTIFLAMISGREDGVVVRLFPKIEVDKTDGVKKILSELAKQLIAKFSELKVGETNLQDFLNS
jgi:hypothetical protein